MLVVPSSSPDYVAVLVLAKAYFKAAAGLKKLFPSSGEDLMMYFPAYTNAAFSLELYMRGLLMRSQVDAGLQQKKYPHGHPIEDYWKKMSAEMKALIAGMFRNPEVLPFQKAAPIRIEVFERQLASIGVQPFADHRYIYEKFQGRDVRFLPIEPLIEILEALDKASAHICSAQE